jgi:predicted Zn finger-like uncharacterized protein
MIIQCINCNKKFEVSSNLIPQLGRNIQCGSCNHTWFYKTNTEITHNNLSQTNEENIVIQENKIKKNDSTKDDEKEEDNKEIIINHDLKKVIDITDQQQIKKTSNLNIEKIFSYFTVGIITFIALIIILDTFETPLNNKFPNLELILYNLFETIKDISLFIKNLLV